MTASQPAPVSRLARAPRPAETPFAGNKSTMPQSGQWD
jgi:hypothetical protein